ncbi:MAG: permease YjgP/YjgQ family protein [Fibrobacteres bacterium]|nr:permease YjgP/YjgQ family protein [Fibrobacterota bacterium]
MKIHTRHVLKGFLGLLLLTVVSIVVIFVVIDFVGNSKVWLTRAPKEVLRYYMDFLPHILYLILPIAVLLASVFSIGNMSRNLELVALRAAGIPVTRILAPILLFGLVASGVMFWFEDAVLPDANHRRYEINEPKSQDGDQGGDPLEKFNYLFTASDGTVLYFDFYSGHRNTGQGITVISQPKHGPMAMRIDARSMVWEKDMWMLRDGTKRVFYKGVLDSRPFKELPFPEFKDKPKDLLDDRSYPEEMGINELDRRIAILQRSGESSRVLETERHFRFSSSLVNLFMALIGTAMSVHTVKAGLARNFGVALLITFLYYVALRLGLVMGQNGSLSPVVGAWLGNLIFAPLGFLLLWKAARV